VAAAREHGAVEGDVGVGERDRVGVSVVTALRRPSNAS
jgi:hypothetical protein